MLGTEQGYALAAGDGDLQPGTVMASFCAGGQASSFALRLLLLLSLCQTANFVAVF